LPVDEGDRALFATATRVQVHNGKTARFWTDYWLNGVAPDAMFPSLFQHSKRKGRTVAEAMTNENWIGDLMHNLTVELLIEYALLWELIDASHYDQHDHEEDSIIWSLTGDGEYSVKSAYSAQFEGSVQSIFPFWVWKV
jgi:hypothetical protein